MGRVIVVNHLSLDGVMQAPATADEDTRDGFSQGGWAVARSDGEVAAQVGPHMGGDHAFLFGRRSYEGMLAGWNARGGPFREALNATPKYVASRDPEAELPWPNTHRLGSDVPGAVAELKRTLDRELVVMGSGELIGTLLAAGLVDRLFLMIHPITLGEGRRLFPGGVREEFALVDCVPTGKGVLLTTYERAA